MFIPLMSAPLLDKIYCTVEYNFCLFLAQIRSFTNSQYDDFNRGLVIAALAFIWMLAVLPPAIFGAFVAPDLPADPQERQMAFLPMVVTSVVIQVLTVIVLVATNVITFRFVSRNSFNAEDLNSLKRLRKATVTAAMQFASTCGLQVTFENLFEKYWLRPVVRGSVTSFAKYSKRK